MWPLRMPLLNPCLLLPRPCCSVSQFDSYQLQHSYRTCTLSQHTDNRRHTHMCIHTRTNVNKIACVPPVPEFWQFKLLFGHNANHSNGIELNGQSHGARRPKILGPFGIRPTINCSLLRTMDRTWALPLALANLIKMDRLRNTI